MKFSYVWLKELAKFKETPAALAELLTLRAFEVESVTKQRGDAVLDVKLIPNRVADASGHIGLAREIATLKDSRFKIKDLRIAESSKRKAADVISVKIENPRDCARYTARVIDGVTVAAAPRWVRERLEACGIQSISNIVDAANYVMLEYGQPLHVFDYDKLTANGSQKREIPISKSEISNKSEPQNPKTITVRRAKRGERMTGLDDKTYELSPEVLVIANGEGAIGIAGIKGGKNSGVSAKTKALVLEAANFDSVRIRIGSQWLGLKTDASYRFERGLDPNATERAIDRLAELIVGTAGGEVLAGRVDVYPRQPPKRAILLRPAYSKRLIGAKISPRFIAEAFARLGWEYIKKGADFVVSPPTNRLDITIEEDIIEEIVRLYGYEKIAPKAPALALAPAVLNEERRWEERIRDRLVGQGLTEAYVYEFIGAGLLSIFGSSAKGLLELENPTSAETRYLTDRPAMHLSRIAAENLRREPNIRLFGIAKAIAPNPKPASKSPAIERKELLLAVAVKSGDDESFLSVKGITDDLLESLGIGEHWYDDALTVAEKQRAAIFHPYRRALLKADSETLGMVGELNPDIAERLKAKTRIALVEIDFKKLVSRVQGEAEYQAPSRFPSVIRDIAIVVPDNVKTDDVTNVIENAAGRLLADTDLFDYFQDGELRKRGEKSLAFHLIFQSPERTLTDKEVNRLVEKVVAAAGREDWEVRE